MTIDDRLRAYAARWDATQPPRAAPVVVLDGRHAVEFVEPTSVPRRRQPLRLTAAAAVVVLVGAAAVSAAVLIHTDTSTPAGAAAESAPYRIGTVNEPTPIGQLIPQTRRVGAAGVGGALLTGGTWSLTSQLGRVVVVSAWGSWCGPCQDYAPALDEQVRPGVSVVGFAVREADAGVAEQFVESHGITYPVVDDRDATVVTALAGPFVRVGVPITFLIDRRGGIAAAYVGTNARTGLDPAIAELLAE